MCVFNKEKIHPDNKTTLENTDVVHDVPGML